MSYPAQRWARAQVLRIGRDPMAIAVLGVIADAYRPDGRVPLNRAAIALRVGASRRETIVAALKRLASLNLISYDVIRNDAGIVLGTLYRLTGFAADEWPEDRVGEAVMVEEALKAGCTRQPWWPAVNADGSTLPPSGVLPCSFNRDSAPNGDSPLNTETLSASNAGTSPRQTQGPLPVKQGDLSPLNAGTSMRQTVHKTVLDGIDGRDGKDGREKGADAPANSDLPPVHLNNADNANADGSLFHGETLTDSDAIKPTEKKLTGKAKASPMLTVDSKEVAERFNSLVPSLPRVTRLTPQRRAAIQKAANALAADADLKSPADVMTAFEKFFADVEASDYLTGRNGRWTACAFDWLLKPANFLKVCEGNYRNRRPTVRAEAAPRRPTDPQAGLGVCQPPKGPHHIYTEAERLAKAEETRKELGDMIF